MKRFFDEELETYRSHLILMGETAVRQVQDAVKALVTGDVGLADRAIAIVRRDSEVDQLNRQLYRELTSFMIEKPETISRALELMFISKSLERIADHASNIAEEMVFLAQARDIRHSEELKKTHVE